MIRRTVSQEDPFRPLDEAPPWGDIPSSRYFWLKAPKNHGVWRARLRFSVEVSGTLRFHITAGRRYELKFDGQFVGMGPERSEPHHWCYESFEVHLEPGEHEFSARLLGLPIGKCPWYLMDTGTCDFLFAAEAPYVELSTGLGAWEVQDDTSVKFLSNEIVYRNATGLTTVQDLTVATQTDTKRWLPGEKNPDLAVSSALRAGHFSSPVLLCPASLPPQRYSRIPVEISPFELAPGETFSRRIPLGNYYTFYTEVTLSGDGELELGSAEHFCDEDGTALPRDSQDGKLGATHQDFYRVHGPSVTGRSFFMRSGSFILLKGTARNTPLKVEKLVLYDTGYPWKVTAKFSGTREMNALAGLLRRTWEKCSFDTFVDCPFYEGLMYVGDMRIEALISNVLTSDHRLQRKAAKLFDQSRDWRGLTASSYPCHSRQTIPGFSLTYLSAMHDNLMWDPQGEALVKELKNGIYSVMDAWTANRTSEGWLVSLPGWNFVGCNHWQSKTWGYCVPPGGLAGQVSPVLNMLFLCYSREAVQLCRHLGENARADMYESIRAEVARLLMQCHVSETNLFADDFGKTEFSSICQYLAILSGAFVNHEGEGVFNPTNHLYSPGFYFSHYALEAAYQCGRETEFLRLQRTWDKLLEAKMFTTPEEDIWHGRSDCHAWSASLVYHWCASLVGIRPAKPGFRSAVIRPLWNGNTPLKGRMPHPQGGFFDFEVSSRRIRIGMPPAVGGTLKTAKKEIALLPGTTEEIIL